MRACASGLVLLVACGAGRLDAVPSPTHLTPQAPTANAPVPLPVPVPVPVLAKALPETAAGGWTPPAKPARVPSCPNTVAELPASSLYDPGDRRLKRRGLVVVDKTARSLMVYGQGRLQGCFRVGLGFAPQGHKQAEGDGRTPQGWYRSSDKPWSMFSGAIAIHYPNVDDARTAYRDGEIGRATRDRIVAATRRKSVPPQRTAMGGAILIHGGGSNADWTLGCVALEDEELEQLRGMLPRAKRTDVLILP